VTRPDSGSKGRVGLTEPVTIAIGRRPAPPPRYRRGGSSHLLLIVLTAGLVLSVTLGVAIGSVAIAPQAVWKIVGTEIVGWLPTTSPQAPTWNEADRNIVMLVRLPRVLLGALVGAGLSVVGVAIQALVRNPLADPYLLGVSSGASVGATAVILLGAFAALGHYALSFGAFLGALTAVAVVFAVAQRHGQVSPLRLILAGVAMAYVFAALTSLMIFTSSNPNAVQSVLFWLLGSLAGARWSYLGLPAVVLVTGIAYLVLQSRNLNSIVVGDDTAATLGLDIGRFRRRIFLFASLLTGVLVAVSGAIGFVGLMMPHVVRIMVGSDHRRVLPVAALLGASFMVWVDVGARTLAAPQELPVGIITALLGAPFFVFLMRSNHYGLKGAS
jgi:iron complex transport system permease protein